MSNFGTPGPFWGGPHWGGPHWGGPHWGGPHAGVAPTDPVAASAMTLLRQTITAYKPLTSAIVAPQWSNEPGVPAPTPDPTIVDRQLLAYDSGVRQLLLIGQLDRGLTLSSSTSGIAVMHGNDVVALLSSPAPWMAHELQITQGYVAAIRGEKSLVALETFMAEDQEPLAHFMQLLGMENGARPHTVELLSVAIETLGRKIFAMKHALGIQRPCRQDVSLLPLLGVPSHLSCPGGHAAKCYLAATLLSALLPSYTNLRGVLFTLSGLISDNRVNAARHYPVDGAAGEVLGRGLAHWLMATASVDRQEAWQGAALETTGSAPQLRRQGRDPVAVTPDIPGWRQLWAAAAAEWA